MFVIHNSASVSLYLCPGLMTGDPAGVQRLEWVRWEPCSGVRGGAQPPPTPSAGRVSFSPSDAESALITEKITFLASSDNFLLEKLLKGF